MPLFPGSQVRSLQGYWLLVLLVWLPEVQGNCTTPEPPPHSSLVSGAPGESYFVGTVLTYRCITGYEPISGIKSSITCLNTSEWSEVPIFCRGKPCSAPSIDNGKGDSEDILRLGDNVTFSCNHGFRIIGDATIFCILRAGAVVWSRDFPHCQRIPCARPEKILNGLYDPNPDDEYYYGSLVIYHCEPEFSLIGNSTIECIVEEDNVNGKWNQPPPECKKVKCEQPKVQNGLLMNLAKPSYTYNEGVSFQCEPGYRPVGSMLITCGPNNSWLPAIPQCLLSVTHPQETIHSSTTPKHSAANTHQPSSTPKHDAANTHQPGSTPKVDAATTHQPSSTPKHDTETTHRTSTTSKNNAGYNIKIALGEWIIVLALLVFTV